MAIAAATVLLAVAYAYAWSRMSVRALAEAKSESARVVIRVGAPLPVVTLYELSGQDAQHLVGMALEHARRTGLPGHARADFIDLFLLNDKGTCFLKVRLTSKDDSSEWSSRAKLIAAAQSGRKFAKAERDAFFDSLSGQIKKHILRVY